MGPVALSLALGAAFLHALWNLLLRGRVDTQAASAAALAIGVVALVPIAAFTWNVDAAAWPYVVASGGLELAYLAMLAAAYGRFELSVVYPVARGFAPIWALVFAVVVVSASPSAGEVAGVLVVASGILLVRGKAGGRGAALGLVIAAAIGGYTVVDRYGIRHADAVSYLLLVMLGPRRARAGAPRVLRADDAHRNPVDGRLRTCAARAPARVSARGLGSARDERRDRDRARRGLSPRARDAVAVRRRRARRGRSCAAGSRLEEAFDRHRRKTRAREAEHAFEDEVARLPVGRELRVEAIEALHLEIARAEHDEV